MTEKTRRLFFALWPDDAIRRGIVERREMLGRVSRKRVPEDNLHLTLLFLGDQPTDRLAEFEALAGAVCVAGFELRLDRFGWFPAARVLWLGGDAPEALQRLQADLFGRVEALGVDPDRRPFRPHVTLYRQVVRPPEWPDPPPLAWPVRSFVLVESIPGRPYQVLRSWPVG